MMDVTDELTEKNDATRTYGRILTGFAALCNPLCDVVDAFVA